MQQIKTSNKYFRLLFNIQRYVQGFTPYSNFTPTIDAIDLFSNNEFPFQKHRGIERTQFINVYSMRYFMESESNRGINIENMAPEEIDDLLQDLLINNKYAHITNIINDCLKNSKLVSDNTVKKLFRTYSMNGRIDAVEILQIYCSKLNPNLNKRNGEFLHYLAKAHCMKGNSENGLLILKQAYVKYEGLRSFYRVIFRELIYDSVQNRSEASLVIFTKYVLIFSEIWNDHYPLICFWHTCWSSSWFSDQMLSNDLLENSEALRKIVQDKATTFCINILKEYNEDAVVRLLQTLLKYEMMVEYTKVLNILFAYKLQNRDLRGCTEILKNCEALGISLSSYQQGKYIKMLINSKYVEKKPDDKPKSPSANFKLKF